MKLSHPFYGIPYIGPNTVGGTRFGTYSVAVTLSNRFDLALKVWRRRSWPEHRVGALKWIEAQGFSVLKHWYVNPASHVDFVSGEPMGCAAWDNSAPDPPDTIVLYYVHRPGSTAVKDEGGRMAVLGTVRDVYQLLKRGVRPVSHSLGFSGDQQRWQDEVQRMLRAGRGAR